MITVNNDQCNPNTQDIVSNQPQFTPSCDYITVVHMDAATGKFYEVDQFNQIKKTPAANSAAGSAQTYYCPDLQTFKQINELISNDIHKAIILGFIRGTEGRNGAIGDPYRLMSVRQFETFALSHGFKVDKFNKEPINVDGVFYATRTKRMFHASTIFVFDKDTVEGMPQELKPDATFDEWWGLMNQSFPEINSVDYLVIPSASSRVLHNGVPMSSGNVHVYIQAEEATDIERFGRAALIGSFGRGCGFMRPILEKATGKQIGSRSWTLFDPTTFSRERLCFDGSPIVDPNSVPVLAGVLKVVPSTPMLFKGTLPRVNTRLLPTPSEEEQRKWDLQFNVGKGGRVSCRNVNDLKPDIILHTKNDLTGEERDITMKDFVDGPVDRLRCNTPFRPDSSSWAAFISKEDGCQPFLFDVGTHTNYMYNDAAEQFHAAGYEQTEQINIIENNNIQAKSGTQNLNQNVNNQVIQNEAINTNTNMFNNSSTSNNGNHNTNDLTHNQVIQNEDIQSERGLRTDNHYNRALDQINLTPNPQFNVPAPPMRQPSNSASYANPLYGTLHQTAPEFQESDLGNAQRFVGTYNHAVRFVPIYKSWFNWIGYRWNKCDGGVEFAMAHEMVELMIKEAAQRPDDDTFRKWAKSSCSAHSIKNMVSVASVMPEMVVSQDSIDNHWYQFGVGNGYIDMRLQEEIIGDPFVPMDGQKVLNLIGFMQPDREVFITKSSAIDYVEGAQAPEWQKMIFEIFSGNHELIKFFQRMVGYSMMGLPLEEVTFFLVGEGSNGKSTITGIMDELFGEYKSTVNKNLLMSVNKGNNGESATPGLARLKGIRMAVVTETREGDVLDESMIKSLSGSDKIVARHLHGDPFEYKSMFVTWLATNHPPIIKSEDFGTWRRVLQIPFMRNFAKELGDNLDKGIGDRIRVNEMSGILNWALEGVRLYQVEGLNPPSIVMTATEDYKDSMDVLANWMEDCCLLGDEFSCSTKLLWESYEIYTQSTGDQIIKKGYTLAKKLHARGFVNTRDAGGERGLRGFKGIKLKTNYNPAA